MTHNEETYILDSIIQMKKEIHDNYVLTKENNAMLRDIIHTINVFLSRHHQENSNDFDRNVLANLVSNIFRAPSL